MNIEQMEQNAALELFRYLKEHLIPLAKNKNDKIFESDVTIQITRSIRNGAYMNTDGSFKHDFFEMVDGYEKRLQYDSKNTELPDNPDFEQVQELVMTINAMTLGIAELPVQ